jgi:squalene-hopene/tetraprenyl-beta-curcumene cyclase
MPACRSLLIAVAVLLSSASVAPAQNPKGNDPGEPCAEKLSPAKAAEFLDNVALNWTEQRKCGTCHTNYIYLMGRPALKEISAPAMLKVRGFFENRVANWDKGDKAKPRWDAEVVATAVTLAFNDAQTTGKLHPLTRQALDRMWTLQQPHGAWDWLKCGWPPYEHDDYFGAVFAAVGVGAAPDNYARAESAQKGLAGLRRYLKENPPPDLHHQAMLLWASTRLDNLMNPEQQRATVKKLLALQRPDGGWSLPSLGTWKRRDGKPNDPAAPSDGYGTGMVIYVLRQAGVPANDAHLQRGKAWLAANQRVSGRWFTRSLNNDKFHYITHAGTAFAVMALEACQEKK